MQPSLTVLSAAIGVVDLGSVRSLASLSYEGAVFGKSKPLMVSVFCGFAKYLNFCVKLASVTL